MTKKKEDEETIVSGDTRRKLNSFFEFMRRYHPIFSTMILIFFMSWLYMTPAGASIYVDDYDYVYVPDTGEWNAIHDFAMNIQNICDDVDKPSLRLIIVSLVSLEFAGLMHMLRAMFMRRGCTYKVYRFMSELASGSKTFRNFIIYTTLLYYLYQHWWM